MDTELDQPFSTYAVVPAGVSAIWLGSLPTGTVAPRVSVRVSISVTEPRPARWPPWPAGLARRYLACPVLARAGAAAAAVKASTAPAAIMPFRIVVSPSLRTRTADHGSGQSYTDRTPFPGPAGTRAGPGPGPGRAAGYR